MGQSKKKRAAERKITPRERKWALAVLCGMSHKAAAIEAGWPVEIAKQSGYRCSRKPSVINFMAKLQLSEKENALEARRQILRRLWDIIDGQDDTKDRLKAIDAVAKLYSLFVEKREVTVDNTVQVHIVLPDNGRNPELPSAHGGGAVVQLSAPEDAEFVEPGTGSGYALESEDARTDQAVDLPPGVDRDVVPGNDN